jgi:TM2 domain-containing membrane protein YozV
MKCALHTEVDATGYCRNCGKAMCAGCQREVSGVLYCEGCLADLVARPKPAADAGSPALAAVLGLIPGLGAVYNGEYMKALIHVLIFGGLIVTISSGQEGGAEPLFRLLLAAFYLYMPIEAYRTAKARAEGRRPAAIFGNFAAAGEKPLGAYILIGLGGLFLLSNLGLFRIGLIFRFWPVVLIIVGVMMLRKRMQRPAPQEGGNE